MNAILYRITNARRTIVIYIHSDTLKKRREERTRAKRLGRLCCYGGVAIELCQKGLREEVER